MNRSYWFGILVGTFIATLGFIGWNAQLIAPYLMVTGLGLVALNSLAHPQIRLFQRTKAATRQ
jgi:hypothetical protein